MKDTGIFILCLLFGVFSTSLAKPSGDVNRTVAEGQKAVYCSSVFQEVGEHCLFVDKTITGSWESSRDICQDLGGDLPNLQDANFLADINDYLNLHHLDDVNYWVGSNDLNNEGVWQWANDNIQVKLGTPLWGDEASGVQDPQGGFSENCGALMHGDYFFMHDETCSSAYALLCQQYNPPFVSTTTPPPTYPETTESETTSTWASNTAGGDKMSISSSSEECPAPYKIINGKCLFINTLAENTWDAHKTSCESLGGHMAKINDANLLGSVFDHLMQEGIKGDFWIGASDNHQENQWFWDDGTEVRLGTPFWGDNGAGPQNPDGGVTDNCAYLADHDHFFFNDGDCDSARFVICQIDISQHS